MICSYHTGVLVKEVIEILNPDTGEVILDGTVGGATHSKAIASRISPGGKLIALDKDMEAVLHARKALNDFSCEVVVKKYDFVDIDKVCFELGIDELDGILFDIGLSSHQLDTPERGFSYQYDGPLDMRMDKEQKLSAKDVVNKFSAREISEILWKYGEERWSKKIAAMIEKKRKNKEFETTDELVKIIKESIPAKAREKGPHPAKRTFQALRIYVNQELEKLEQALEKGVDLIKPGGRFVVISFHSLEDRIVKNKFREFEMDCKCPPRIPACICGEKARGRVITKKPIQPSEEEIKANHRARSAKLRAFLKISDT